MWIIFMFIGSFFLFINAYGNNTNAWLLISGGVYAFVGCFFMLRGEEKKTRLVISAVYIAVIVFLGFAFFNYIAAIGSYRIIMDADLAFARSC